MYAAIRAHLFWSERRKKVRFPLKMFGSRSRSNRDRKTKRRKAKKAWRLRQRRAATVTTESIMFWTR